MKASTHTEIYRRYEGSPKKRPSVERILAWSGIRLGLRRKWPAFFLFTPAVITALVGCVTVHLTFNLGAAAQKAGMDPDGAVAAGITSMLGSVSFIILQVLGTEQFLALLTLSWYGSALIAEDRRLSANLLYFARPITPLRYISGKMLTAFAFGAMTLLLPLLMICSQAALSSPDWLFLKEQHMTIWRVMGFSTIWVLVMSSVILAISSCFKRKGLALMSIFAFVFIIRGVTEFATGISGNENFGMLSLTHNFQAIADWLFSETKALIQITMEENGRRGPSSLEESAWNIEGSFWALGIMTLISWVVLWRNVKRMEVIA